MRDILVSPQKVVIVEQKVSLYLINGIINVYEYTQSLQIGGLMQTRHNSRATTVMQHA